ncbi:MAG: beta-aspartyl-peptidase [Planctomycetota bacterium]
MSTFTLLRNGEVFAPEPCGLADILIAGQQIAAVGRDLPSLSSYGATEIDLRGRRVIPGLIDGHAHITGGGGEAGYETRVPPVPLSEFTRGGITTVVGLLGTDDVVRTPGQVVAAAYALRAEGLSAYCYTGGYHVPPATVTGSVRGDIVHIDPVIGVGEVAISDHRSSQPTRDEILRLAGDTHVAGLMTSKAGVLHLHLGDGERGLAIVRDCLDASEIPARVFQPTHVNRRRALFAEALQLAADGCNIDVTAFPEEDLPVDGEELPATAALLSYLDADLPHDRITVSTDGGGCLPTFNADGRVASIDVGRPNALALALQKLLAQGAGLDRVLPAFTSNVAGLLRLPGKGAVSAGACADLVVLGDDHSVEDVWARGQRHVDAGRPILFGAFERVRNIE